MKVTIIDDKVIVEDLPAHDQRLSEEDGDVVAIRQALIWAMRGLAETADPICADHQQQGIAAEQANQVHGRLRMGMH